MWRRSALPYLTWLSVVGALLTIATAAYPAPATAQTETTAASARPHMDAGVGLLESSGDVADPAADQQPMDEAETHASVLLVVRIVLGLVALVFLSWLATHPRARRVEDLLGVRQVITAGFAFVALGMAARHPAIGVLSDEVLQDLTPILHFALGWIGFVIGFQFDVRMLERLPRGTAVTVGIETMLPFIVIAGAASVTLSFFGEAWTDPHFLRHAIALGAAGAVSVIVLRDRPPLWRAGEGDASVGRRIDSLDEVAGVVGLALVGAFFRPSYLEWRWELPGTVWLFITLGMGAAVGLLIHAMSRSSTSKPEFLALTFGSIALASGMAGYVHLSPVVVCFIAGAVVTNLPADNRERLWSTLTTLERPLYYMLLVVAGALWDVRDWRGWALMGAFLVSRAIGAWLGGVLIDRRAAQRLPVVRNTHELLRPISPVSIAIVVSLQSMYHGDAIAWIVTAVIGAAIVTEVLVQVRRRMDGEALA